jgi:hypothetical protein
MPVRTETHGPRRCDPTRTITSGVRYSCRSEPWSRCERRRFPGWEREFDSRHPLFLKPGSAAGGLFVGELLPRLRVPLCRRHRARAFTQVSRTYSVVGGPQPSCSVRASAEGGRAAVPGPARTCAGGHSGRENATSTGLAEAGCLHLVFGGRPRSHRASFRPGRPRRDGSVTLHESSPPCASHRTGSTSGSPERGETHAPTCSVQIRRPGVTSRRSRTSHARVLRHR